ncbi:MAG: hypothetical protein MJE77_38145 [Proteobacteria bacterium]|nr:hypothetical protein [Pseudomonadota bacterium]
MMPSTFFNSSSQRPATAVVVACVLCGPVFPVAGESAVDDEEKVGGIVLVDISPGPGSQPWIARALEQHIRRELSSYQRFTVIEGKERVPGMAPEKPLGSENGLAGSDLTPDIEMIGIVSGDSLNYVLYETWTPAQVARGSIHIGAESSLIRLKQETLDAFGPFLKQGGLLDQKPYLAGIQNLAPPGGTDADESDTGNAAQVSPEIGEQLRIAGWILFAAAWFFALPFLFTALALGDRRFDRGLWRLVGVPSFPLAMLVGATCLILASFTWIRGFSSTATAGSAAALIPPVLSGQPATWEWLIAVAGGMAWGWLVLATLRFVVPPLHGLDRVAHRDVFRLIRAWLIASIQRAVLLAVYYLPFAWALLWVVGFFDIPRSTAIIVFAPATGLLARSWFLSWVHGLTLYLDDRLVEGPATRDNPWHHEIQRYFTGYLRRTGWAIDQRLLSRILFLPGKRDGVVCYGGGLIESRIVIGEKLLVVAMGGLEEALPGESRVDMPDWSAGIVIGQEKSSNRQERGGPDRRPGGPSRLLQRLLGRPRDRELRSVDRQRSTRRRRVRSAAGGPKRKQLGQAATLLGYVVPAAPGELVPLIADSVQDLEVVRELLSEHYAWFAPDPDEEHDDTDPTDRDFLFGALAGHIGAIERQDNQRATLALACEVRISAGSGLFRAIASVVYGVPQAIVGRFLARYPTMIADAYPALHYARHPLIQYLYYLASQEEQFLTTRASADELHRSSTRILREVAKEPRKGIERQFFRASIRNRLVWLSRFSESPIADPRETRLGWITACAIALAFLIGLGTAVMQAIEYHPIYVDRIAEQQRQLQESLRDEAQDHQGHPAHGRQDTRAE